MLSRLVALLALVFVAVVAGLPAAVLAQEATPTAPAPVGDRTDIRYFVPFGPDGLNPALRVTDEVTGSCNETSLADIGRGDAWFCNAAETGAIHDPCFENAFGPPDGPATLACVASPFATEAVLFTTTQPLRREKENQPATRAVAPAPPDVVVPSAGAATGPGTSTVPDVPLPGLPPGSVEVGRSVTNQILVVEDPSGGAVSAEVAVDPLSIPWAVELANGDRCTLLTGATAVVAGMRINYGCEGGGSIVGELDRGSPVWTANVYDERSLGTELVEVATVWT